MSDGYSFCIQFIWCFGWSKMLKCIHVPILVALHHSTDCSVVLPQCTEVDRCTSLYCSSSTVPPFINCKVLKWFRALREIAPRVKVANPHPHTLSTRGVSTWVTVDLLGGIVPGVTKPVQPIGTLWVVPDYLITAISGVVVGQPYWLTWEAGSTRQTRWTRWARWAIATRCSSSTRWTRRTISSIFSRTSRHHWTGVSDSCCPPD